MYDIAIILGSYALCSFTAIRLRNRSGAIWGTLSLILLLILSLLKTPNALLWVNAVIIGIILLKTKKNYRLITSKHISSQGNRPIYSALQYLVYSFLSLILAIVGLALLCYELYRITFLERGSIGLLFSGLLMAILAHHFLLEADKLEQVSATDILQTDHRKPVLYLRSFLVDKTKYRRLRNPNLWKPWRDDWYKLWLGNTFEEELSHHIQRNIGPLIALGDPEDSVPAFGANKMYCEDHNWKDAAGTLCKQAQAIIIMEGVTPGLDWELDYVRNNTSPELVFLCTFPLPYRSLNSQYWNEFRTLTALSKITIPARDPGAGCILAFDHSWSAEIVGEKLSTGDSFAQCIMARLSASIQPASLSVANART